MQKSVLALLSAPSGSLIIQTTHATSLADFSRGLNEETFLANHPEYALTFNLLNRSLEDASAFNIKQRLMVSEEKGEEILLSNAIFSAVDAFKLLESCRNSENLISTSDFLGQCLAALKDLHNELQQNYALDRCDGFSGIYFQIRNASPDLIEKIFMDNIYEQAVLSGVIPSKSSELPDLSWNDWQSLWKATADHLHRLLSELHSEIPFTLKNPPAFSHEEIFNHVSEYLDKNTSVHKHEQGVLNLLHKIKGLDLVDGARVFDALKSLQNVNLPQDRRQQYIDAAQEEGDTKAVLLFNGFFHRFCIIKAQDRQKADRIAQDVRSFFYKGFKDPLLKTALLTFMARCEAPQNAFDRAFEVLRELRRENHSAYGLGWNKSFRPHLCFSLDSAPSVGRLGNSTDVVLGLKPIITPSFDQNGNMTWISYSSIATALHEFFHQLDVFSASSLYRHFTLPNDDDLPDIKAIEAVEPTYTLLQSIAPIVVDWDLREDGAKLGVSLFTDEEEQTFFKNLSPEEAWWRLQAWINFSQSETWQIPGLRAFRNPQTGRWTLLINSVSDTSLAVHMGLPYRIGHFIIHEADDIHDKYPDLTFGKGQSCLRIGEIIDKSGQKISWDEVMCTLHDTNLEEYHQKLEDNQNSQAFYFIPKQG